MTIIDFDQDLWEAKKVISDLKEIIEESQLGWYYTDNDRYKKSIKVLSKADKVLNS